MLKILFAFLFLFSSLGCSIYKSDGRKNFETQVPLQIQSLKLQDCLEFPWSDQEITQLSDENQNLEVIPSPQNQKSVSLLRARDNSVLAQVPLESTQNCTYRAANEAEWLSSRQSLFDWVDSL